MRTIRRLICGPNQTLITETETIYEQNDKIPPEGGDRILAEGQAIVSNDDMRRLLDYDRKIISGELAEVRHGWWGVERDVLDKPDGTYSKFRMITCSECKETRFISTPELPPFCEKCGAKMDREEPAEADTASADNSSTAAESEIITAEGGKSCNNANDAAGIIQTAAEGGDIAQK